MRSLARQTIFFVSSSGSPGGAERQLANLLNHLQYKTIYLLILDEHKFLESLIVNHNVIITYAPSYKFLRSFVTLFLRLKADQHSRITLVGWMAKANIFVYFLSFLLLPFKSILLIWNHRSSFFLYQSISSQFLLFFSVFLSLFYPRKIIHVSNSFSVFSPRFIRYFLFGVKHVIPNGYDFNKFLHADQSSHSSSHSLPSNKLLLLCPARFSPEKGHQLLFKALERVPFDFHITLVGTGCHNENPKITNLISKIRDKVTLVEHSSSMAFFYSRHHFTVLLSSSESFPNVIVESMAFSVPCICSDVGESKSIVGPFGFVLRSRTLTEACNSLISAYTMFCSDHYSSMCANARSYVLEKYPAIKMVQSFNNLF